MYSQKNKYLLAVSGGVDSCVLFDIFLKKNYDFIVVHFNHLTRGEENFIEQTHVENLCTNNNITFLTYKYIHEGGNFQSSARNFRINKYKELVQKYNLKGVVLAHHLDDNFENMRVFKDKYFNLMEKVATYDGLKIYRPLINQTKKEIYHFAKENNITFYEDSSNKKDKYIRNYHRINNFDVSDEIKKNEVNKALKVQKMARKIRIDNIITKGQFQESRDKKLLIFLLIKHNYPGLNVKHKLIEQIVKAINFCGNKKFDIGSNIQIVQEYEKIFLKQIVDNDFLITKKLVIGLNEFNGLFFENNIENGMIRSRKPNDKILLKNGTKKVTRYMIDHKIPTDIRQHYPIVVNEKDEVLYIPKIIKK